MLILYLQDDQLILEMILVLETLTLLEMLSLLFFFRDPLICLSRGFTRGGRTELNRTDSIARNPLLICLGRGFTWGRFEKLCNKLNFYLLFYIVESLKDGISCSYII